MPRKLNSINDLRNIISESVPSRSLYLLHWFANTIDIDDWNNMRLTFDVDEGDYGSHWYGNAENLLEPLPRGYGYYTIGNVNQNQLRQLPDYVVNTPGGYSRGNRDRILVRAQKQTWEPGGRPFDRVYITQHRSDGLDSSYDPHHTYQITPNLIRELRRIGENQLQLEHPQNQVQSRDTSSQLRFEEQSLRLAHRQNQFQSRDTSSPIRFEEQSLCTSNSDLATAVKLIIAIVVLLSIFVYSVKQRA